VKVEKIFIKVRDAAEDDLDEVANLWENLARHHAGLSDDFALAWDSRRRWSKYLRGKFAEISTKLIVAEEEDEIVGFMLCMLSPNIPIYKERKLGIISDAYVQEERRKKGVTNKMFDVALKWFKKNKVKTVELHVAMINPEAQAVWKSLGFAPFMIYERLYPDKLPQRPVPGVRKRIVRKKKEAKKNGLTQRIRFSRKSS
jgi:ribosomal protein S18 acetylase RimI-like enzyme